MLRLLERLLLVGGVLAVAVFGVNYSRAQVAAAQDIADFKTAVQSIAEPDMSLWSSGRAVAYRNGEAGDRVAIGILRIDRLSVEAPIYAGTSEEVLDRGVGWVDGTARPGGAGNVGLAAHRDGFFRALKDVQIGDRVVTVTGAGESEYTITALEIVSPNDVHVLAPADAARLTLITCHPFYFVGSAPNRFIVHAQRL